MGKSLKGKELGVGISQRPDGTYTGRITDASGKRVQKYFKKLQDCRQWVSEKQFNISHGDMLNGNDPTVTAGFSYWLGIKKRQVRVNTYNGYENMWNKHIKPVIGDKLVSEIKPIHCIEILQRMSDKGFRTTTIYKVKTMLRTFFDFCLENGAINFNPVTKSVKATGKEKKETRFLTIEEQKDFLTNTIDSVYYIPCAFILQTGIRIGELSAITWNDIDFENRLLKITRCAKYRMRAGWEFSETKTKASVRNIPLTEEAIRLLWEQKKKKSEDKIIDLRYKDLVFSNKNGVPSTTSNYNLFLKNYCDKANVKCFSVHSLRHTFATRCIEAGMSPKTLQKILGHSKISMTMDLYVHTTDETKKDEMKMVEKMLKII